MHTGEVCFMDNRIIPCDPDIVNTSGSLWKNVDESRGILERTAIPVVWDLAFLISEPL